MRRTLAVLIGMLSLAAPLAAQEAADAVQPEAAGAGTVVISPEVAQAQRAKADGVPVRASDWMVVAANPHAVQAGARVLAEGGTAADAMVAVQAVLGLVEPQSSGLGGGAFLVWYDGQSGQMTRSMVAKPRLWPPRRASFRTRPANRCSFSTPWWGGDRSVCRARPP